MKYNLLQNVDTKVKVNFYVKFNEKMNIEKRFPDDKHALAMIHI